MAQKHQIGKLSRRQAAHPEAQVFVNLLRTADALERGAEALLKPFGLSGTQYNVLRILRGAGESGLACREIGCRLISHDPDITRLLDRMESRGLITRAREAKDRRVVKTRITADGLRILGDLDDPIQKLHRRQFRGFPARQLRQLSILLEQVRTRVEAPDAFRMILMRLVVTIFLDPTIKSKEKRQ